MDPPSIFRTNMTEGYPVKTVDPSTLLSRGHQIPQRATADLCLGKQQRPHLELGFVKLRLGVSDGAVKQLRDLVVLIALHLMQRKNGPATFRKFLEGAPEGDAIHNPAQIEIALAEVASDRGRFRVYWLIQRNRGSRLAPAHLHEHCVHRNAVEPCRKS